MKKILKKFNVLGMSGRGGYARLYMLKHETTNKLFALKESGLTSKNDIKEILLEGRNTKIRHKNILWYASVAVCTRFKELHGVQDTTEPESRPDSGMDNKYIRQFGMQNLYIDSQEGNKYYHYLLTKYANFTLRDYLEMRNDYIFCENSDSITNISVRLSNLIPKPFTASEVQISSEFLCKGLFHIGQVKIINKHYVNALFRGILNGVSVLHSRNLTHCDLKPENIFFLEEDNYIPKIGDFGKTRQVRTGCIGCKRTCDNHTRPCKRCSKSLKKDIYDLGLIYFKLLWPMKTISEMYYVLGAIKEKRKFPPVFLEENYKEFKLIESCINPNIYDRPSTRQILIILDSF